MGKPWGIYARVSTKEQATEGLSIDAQLTALREHFKQRKIAVREFVDAGRSAWTENIDKRPGFKDMLEAARRGEIEGIGVTHLDRFSRKLIVTLQVLGELGQMRLGFVSLENSAFDFSKPADRLLMANLGAFSEYYSNELSRKVKRSIERRAANGLHVGLLPFGYCSGRCQGCDGKCGHRDASPKDAPASLHPEDAPGVELAFKAYRQGTHSDQTIARVLNDAGYRSRTQTGRVKWGKSSVRKLLTNKFYTGVIVLHGQELPGKHPVLIPRELFEEVQAIRHAHHHSTSSFKHNHHVNLLAGLLVCAGCGHKMRALAYGGTDNHHSGYRCASNESGRFTCDAPQTMTRARTLEAQFGEIVKQFHLPPDWRERVAEMLAQNGERRNREDERKQTRQKLERIKWLFAEGDLTQAEYSREKRTLEARLAAIVDPEEREILDAGAYLENLAAVWDQATPEERKQVAMALITQAVCDTKSKRLISIRPRPAFLPLFRQCAFLRERDGEFCLPDSRESVILS